jgi:tetratricopeptide (TPR) repeat protein
VDRDRRGEEIAIDGEAYELFRRGTALLADRHAHQAATVLERVMVMEPERGSVREALGRAYYGSGRPEAAREQFAKALELDPANDYAHFCMALCLLRSGEVEVAIGHLRLALAMRPEVDDYQRALVRAERMRPADSD